MVWLQGYSLTIVASNFIGGSAPLGGAVALANGSALTTSAVVFGDCQAEYGGAVYAAAPMQTQLQTVLAPPFPSSLAYPSTVYTYGRQMGSSVSLINST